MASFDRGADTISVHLEEVSESCHEIGSNGWGLDQRALAPSPGPFPPAPPPPPLSSSLLKPLRPTLSQVYRKYAAFGRSSKGDGLTSAGE